MARTPPHPARGKFPPWHKSLGPVADLESHLPDDWWQKLFNALYLKTDGDVVENTDNTRAEVDFIVANTMVTPASRILDLCCGQGRHVLELSRRGYEHVSGLDRSRYLIRLARKRASIEKLTATFKEGDARNPRLPTNTFDCVTILGNSFGYFSDKKDDEEVLSAVGKLLRQSGMLVLDIADGEWLRANFEARSWEWIDDHHFVCRERSLAADGERLVSREVIVHDEIGVIADQFYAERLYSFKDISELLEQTGFRNVLRHEVSHPLSIRDQDLGMMARRVLLTARAPVKVVPAKRDRMKSVKVTVLLGDPRLPDKVKRGGKFNSDDHETVQRLKDALAEIDGFEFDYINNHATLARDLSELRSDLVFNLCDEGFNNDAFKELHVPALLELHDLPYTGAPPACLAVCYDKSLVRAISAQLDVPIPLESFIRPHDQGATLPSVFPALLKPNFGDSSVGITRDAVVYDKRALMSYLDELHSLFPGRPVLVQEFLTGPEYSVGLIGNPRHGLTALPILEVDYGELEPGLPKILGYESKWLPESPYWQQIRYREADLSENKKAQIIDYSIRLFERLGCRDYARFDFRADSAGTVKLLEANPNPGWCWDGKQNLMAGFRGIRYADLLETILKVAVDRLGLIDREDGLLRRVTAAA